jgi:hypothetical protein
MLVAMLVVVAGCSGGEACETADATRCMDDNVETCVSGEWTVTVDCVAAGQECMQDDTMMEGEAHCMAGMEM